MEKSTQERLMRQENGLIIKREELYVEFEKRSSFLFFEKEKQDSSKHKF